MVQAVIIAQVWGSVCEDQWPGVDTPFKIVLQTLDMDGPSSELLIVTDFFLELSMKQISRRRAHPKQTKFTECTPVLTGRGHDACVTDTQHVT